MPTFRQCATGIVISGNAWWLGIHTAGNNQGAVPQFDPPAQARVIESHNQDRPGDDYWRWSGALTGERTIVRMNRGDCFDAYLPGGGRVPAVVVENWAPGDWNFDGVVNSNDLSAFLTAWIGSMGQPAPAGDFNLDGQVNSSDISAFLTAWLSQ